MSSLGEHFKGSLSLREKGKLCSQTICHSKKSHLVASSTSRSQTTASSNPSIFAIITSNLSFRRSKKPILDSSSAILLFSAVTKWIRKLAMTYLHQDMIRHRAMHEDPASRHGPDDQTRTLRATGLSDENAAIPRDTVESPPKVGPAAPASSGSTPLSA